tara:strand:- start:7156 stop:8817 length:1662 start_codon:yes stop_codon:yes gene_type:complete
MEISNPVSVIEKHWKPNARGQEEVLKAPDSIFEILGGGAAGGGKTDLGLILPIIRQFTEHPKFKALVMRRTFADLEKEIVPRQHEWYAPSGGTYNETKKVWKWPSGARIQNGHAEKESDVRKYDSAEYNYIDWDESTHFTKFQYLYLSLSRCRSSSPDLPAIVRAFTNPGNIGHQFFKQRFVDPNPRGRKILRDKVTGEKRMYIPFLGVDNPHLSVNDPGYLKRLEGMPEAEKRAKLYGDWDAYEGQVFSEYRIMHIPGEPENAVHVIPPFIIPEWWPRILAIDWGHRAMTFAIWAAISPEGRVYIYRTYHCKETFIKVWSREIANLNGRDELADTTICHSANQNRGEDLTIQQQVIEAFDGKYDFRLAPKDRVGGKNLVHEYLRWQQRPRFRPNELKYDSTLANQILRLHGEDKYEEYVSFFKEEPPELNLPKLQILSHTPEGESNNVLIDVIPSCIPSEQNPEDVAEFDGDDPYDALRMILKAAHLYLDEATDKQKEIQRTAQLYAQLQSTNNQTAFYRQMEKMEADGITATGTGNGVRSRRRVGNHRFNR